MENTANLKQKARRLACAALIGLLSCIAVTVTSAFLQMPKQPEYKGRKLTAYLEQIRSATNGNEAVQAVRQIGTNALPHLEALLRAKDSPIKKRALDVLSKQRLIDVPFKSAEDHHVNACGGFMALGASAFQTLTNVVLNESNPISRWHALILIGGIGNQAMSAIPILLETMSDSNADVRLGSINALHLIFSDINKRLTNSDEPMVKALIKATGDPNYNVNAIAKLTLHTLVQRSLSTVAPNPEDARKKMNTIEKLLETGGADANQATKELFATLFPQIANK